MKITDPFDEFGCLLFDETLMQERLPYADLQALERNRRQRKMPWSAVPPTRLRMR